MLLGMAFWLLGIAGHAVGKPQMSGGGHQPTPSRSALSLDPPLFVQWRCALRGEQWCGMVAVSAGCGAAERCGALPLNGYTGGQSWSAMLGDRALRLLGIAGHAVSKP